jgi:hypothetical protein
MIRGLHGMFYSAQPEATRAFLRDALRLPYTDVGEGWLIFDLPEGDLGVHPTEAGAPIEGSHDVSFYCDDLDGTVADLRSRGVELGPVENRGYGRVTHLTMPGGVRIQLYEPRYTKKSRSASKAPKRRPAKARAAKPRRAATRAKPARRKVRGR